jgi:hypothetical protein
MRLDTDEGLRLIEHKVLEVFCESRTAETLFGCPRGSLRAASELALAGELSLEDLGLSREGFREAAARVRRSGATPEVDAVRIAYTALAEGRHAILRELSARIAAVPAPRP